MPDRSQPDVNLTKSLIVVSNADNVSPVTLWADPTTHALLTSGGAGGSSTQYTQGGATVANPTGTSQIYFDAAGNPKAVGSTQPEPSIITDGTNSANVLKSDGTAAGQNAALIAGTGMTTSTVSLSAGTQSSSWYDMLNYSSVSVEILTNTTPATITWQTSGDASQTNIRSMIMVDSQANINVPALTTSSATGTFIGNRAGRYFRISTNLAGGNTATFVITFYTNPTIPPAATVYGAVVPAAGTNSATAPFGSALLGVFDDVASTAVTENQFGTLRMSTNRNLYGTIRDAAGNERGVNVNASNQLTTVDGASSATGSAVPANAFYSGVNAQTALPTAATAGNLTGMTADKFGRPVVLSGTIRDLVGTLTTTISASIAENAIVTAAASTFNDLTALVISNTSAIAARLDFRDTTGGSILFSIYVPAGDVRGVAFNRPVPQTSVNTNWTAQSSASVTDLRVYAVFDKNK